MGYFAAQEICKNINKKPQQKTKQKKQNKKPKQNKQTKTQTNNKQNTNSVHYRWYGQFDQYKTLCVATHRSSQMCIWSSGCRGCRCSSNTPAEDDKITQLKYDRTLTTPGWVTYTLHVHIQLYYWHMRSAII